MIRNAIISLEFDSFSRKDYLNAFMNPITRIPMAGKASR